MNKLDAVMHNVIVDADCGRMPRSFFDPMPEVTATLDNGETHVLFSYYPDELHFTSDELIGLTVEQALQLRHKKDVTYLRS
jgi:hypothetical protein